MITHLAQRNYVERYVVMSKLILRKSVNRKAISKCPVPFTYSKLLDNDTTIDALCSWKALKQECIIKHTLYVQFSKITLLRAM